MAGVKCRRMVLGDYDRSGRRRPVAGAEGDFVIPADQVIAGIGQKLDTAQVFDGTVLELTQSGFVKVALYTGRTSEDWVFAGGDAALGPASVVDAIAMGERAAVAIDEFLTGEKHAFWREIQPADTFFDPGADPVEYPRGAMQLLPVNKRKGNFQEVELAWSEPVARREAKRCLRCDYRPECKKE